MCCVRSSAWLTADGEQTCAKNFRTRETGDSAGVAVDVISAGGLVTAADVMAPGVNWPTPPPSKAGPHTR